MSARRIIPVLVATACLCRANAAPSTNAASDSVVVGYFAEWGVYARNYHVTNIPAPLLTHVNYAFLRPVYDAASDTARIDIVDSFAAIEKVYPGDSDVLPFKGSFNQLLNLKRAHPHLKTLMSVGGATLSADFSDIAASTRARITFAESCVENMTRYGFDGIDIDWEFPVTGGEQSVRHRDEDAVNLVRLLQTLRNQLDAVQSEPGKRYLLTLAASVTGNTLTNRYRLPELSEPVDWINLMAYQMTGAWAPVTGHQAPLHANPTAPGRMHNVADGVSRYLTLGVPAGKLVLGVPFYGQGFKGVPNTNRGLFQTHSGLTSEGSWSPGIFTYRDLRDGSQGHPYLNSDGFEEFWDPMSQAAYLYGARSRVFVTHPSPRSMELKAEYVRDQGLRGVMCWSLDLDTADHALLRSVNILSQPASTPLAPAEAADH